MRELFKERKDMELIRIDKLVLMCVGLLVGFLLGLYFAAQVFPLSTQETIIVRSR